MHADANVTQPAVTPLRFETANDRWKRSTSALWSNSITIAVVLHFAVFALWPQMTAATLARDADDMTVIAVPEYDVPPPPEPIARPAAPIVGSPELDVKLTIPSTNFPTDAHARVAPPSAPAAAARSDYVAFMPTMVAPRVLNPQETSNALMRNYPPILRDAGVGGKVELLLWLDENGVVTRSQIATSSGQASLDEAALKVLSVMKLSPALNGGKPVRVIVTIPIVFNVR